MNPSQFMEEYRSLSVRLDDNHLKTIDVHKYMINSGGNARVAACAAMMEKLFSKMDAEIQGAKTANANWKKHNDIGPPPPLKTRAAIISNRNPTITPSLLRAVQYGKGSPDANSEFVRLAVRYGLVKEGELQVFADNYLGLDCSGFVANYLVSLGKMSAGDIVNTSASSFDISAQRRKQLYDVKSLDILVWTDTSHVAIIDSMTPIPMGPQKTPPVYTGIVVESNGHRGLDSETYTFKSVDAHGKFTVQRESESKTWHVHVVNRNLGG